MKSLAGWLIQHQAALGLALAGLLVSPPLREILEARMSTHMLLQFPLLLLAGALLANSIPPAMHAKLRAWNAHGIAGLLLAALVLALSMVPRVLDLALVDIRVETVKCATLLLGGAALRISWRPAGTLIQGFFLGNTLPMMAIAGWLYEETPLRLCNAYRLDEQQWLGQALGWVAAGVAAVWIWRVASQLSRPPHANAPTAAQPVPPRNTRPFS